MPPLTFLDCGNRPSSLVALALSANPPKVHLILIHTVQTSPLHPLPGLNYYLTSLISSQDMKPSSSHIFMRTTEIDNLQVGGVNIDDNNLLQQVCHDRELKLG